MTNNVISQPAPVYEVVITTEDEQQSFTEILPMVELLRGEKGDAGPKGEKGNPGDGVTFFEPDPLISYILAKS